MTKLSAKTADTQQWEHFKENYHWFGELGIGLDLSRIEGKEATFKHLESKMWDAFVSMEKLENGAIANPDEGWQVGHYWLRDPSIAPSTKISKAISSNFRKIQEFTQEIHRGNIRGQRGVFKNLLLIGIGGSALGPQFVQQALGSPQRDRLKTYYIDNTDPDGIDLIWESIDHELGQTLVIVISKSGGTPETRNGMLEAKKRYESHQLSFSQHAVAITVEGSKLHAIAHKEDWIDTFPIWPWVGGRTSELSSVGLLPAALQGINTDQLLEGARVMDNLTRYTEVNQNPAALLALSWYAATEGHGKKDMVILPYKDRLGLFPKYLQQLIMESLGKEKDLKGRIVNQGIAVYGNKGSTDQHSYAQQLRDGLNNFFVTFIEVLKDRKGTSMEVERGRTSGDYLHAFLLGTRDALSENGRQSITVTLEDISPKSVGALIALYERAVGFYAHLIGINPYHQPGVEAGKKAAAATLLLKDKILNYLEKYPNQYFDAEQIASSINQKQSIESVFKLLEHLAHNTDKSVARKANPIFHLNQYAYSRS